MEFFKVLIYCLSLQGVGSLVLTTSPGAALRLDTETHVLTVNQSKNFMFEVQSCGTVNITLLNLYQATRIDISIPYGLVNISICVPELDRTSLECNYRDQGSFSPSSCFTARQFWVDVPDWTGYFIGTGCAVRNSSITTMYASGAKIGFHVLLTSDEEATWKFGADACGPPTTTTSTTTTTSQRPDNGNIDLYCRSAGVTGFSISGHGSMCIFFLFPLFKLI